MCCKRFRAVFVALSAAGAMTLALTHLIQEHGWPRFGLLQFGRFSLCLERPPGAMSIAYASSQPVFHGPRLRDAAGNEIPGEEPRLWVESVLKRQTKHVVLLGIRLFKFPNIDTSGPSLRQRGTTYGCDVPILLVIATTLIPPMLFLRQLHRANVRAKRIREHRCTRCGYDIRASADRCPECGHIEVVPA